MPCSNARGSLLFQRMSEVNKSMPPVLVQVKRHSHQDSIAQCIFVGSYLNHSTYLFMTFKNNIDWSNKWFWFQSRVVRKMGRIIFGIKLIALGEQRSQMNESGWNFGQINRTYTCAPCIIYFRSWTNRQTLTVLSGKCSLVRSKLCIFFLKSTDMARDSTHEALKGGKESDFEMLW